MPDPIFSNKTIALLASLTLRERKRFARFLLLNYHEEADLHLLLSHVLENMQVTKEVLFARLYPAQTFDDKKIRYMFTALNKELEEFLTILHVERTPMLANNLLMRELIERGVEKSFNAILTNQKIVYESPETSRDGNYYFNQFLTEEGLLLSASQNFKRKEHSNIELVVDRLDKFYLVRKLQFCCEIVNVQNVLGTNYNVFLLDEITAYLSQHPIADAPIISIYFKILKTLTESDNESHFQDLRVLLATHEALFSLAELREMYQYVMNYCIKKINLGNIAYQRVLFEVYQTTLLNKVLLSEDKISQWDYKNIVTISFRLKELEWAEHFITTYKNLLVPNERENAYNFNLAYLHFIKKEYSKTLSLLQAVDFTDVFYQLDTRAILLKTYFEMDDEFALDYHIKSFKVFLKRNHKISDYQQLIYNNLINYTKQIRSAGTNQKKLAALRETILAKKQTADIQWLLEKLEGG